MPKPLWKRLRRHGQRPLLRDAGAAGKAGRCRPGLADDEEPLRSWARALPQGARRPPRRGPVRRRADPEHDRTALAHERQAPLGGGRRLRQRLCHGNPGPVGLLLLGAAPDDTGVRRRRPLEERRTCAAPPRAARPRGRGTHSASGMPGAPPPLPTSTIAPGNRATRPAPRERVLEEHRRASPGPAERRQSWCRDDGREPRRQAGRTTTYRFGSVPSLAVCTPATSFRRSCTTLRSTGLIGSSSTRSPARRALRTAHGDPLERLAAALAVPGRVDRHRLARSRRGRPRRSRRSAARRSSVRACRSAGRARRRCTSRGSRRRSRRTSTRAPTPIAPTTRSTSSRTCASASDSSCARRRRRRRGAGGSGRDHAGRACSPRRADRARLPRRPGSRPRPCRGLARAARDRAAPSTSPRRRSRPVASTVTCQCRPLTASLCPSS